MIRQNNPRKCVHKSSIANFVFTVQYFGAFHAISVRSASIKVAMHYLSGTHFFLGIPPPDLSLDVSVFFKPFSAEHCISWLSTRRCFLFNRMSICLPNDGFSALMFLILRSVQFDKHFI